jgi:pyruvate/2-oxoglutarate dehydrogenase complex dihydrolipoamide dehydrogenase (E3) component
MLELRELPGHLVVVGGGFIGCEFAQMFRRFGAQVTVIQRADRLIRSTAPTTC